MLTDVFDSVKLAPNNDNLTINRCHARAALYEALIFHEEGIAFNPPQFFDGIANSDEEWRRIIFSLLGKGDAKIAIYNTIGAANKTTDLKDYLKKYVSSRPQNNPYYLSSMPNLSDNYAVNDVWEICQAVWNHLLHNKKKPCLGTSPIDQELARFINFINEFFSLPTQYILDESKPISFTYKEFINSSFSALEPHNIVSLLNLRGTEADYKKLLSAESRSETYRLLTKDEFESVPDSVINDIKKIFDVLNSKFKLMRFSNAEIHLPRIDGKDRVELISRVLGAKSEKMCSFYYENTEALMNAAPMIKSISFDDVITIRRDIQGIVSKDNCNWDEALEKYTTNLTTVDSDVFDIDSKTFAFRDKGKIYQFFSDANKADIIENIKLLEELSFTS